MILEWKLPCSELTSSLRIGSLWILVECTSLCTNDNGDDACSGCGGYNGPLTRYGKLRFAHAPGMPGTFSMPQQVSDPDMHQGTCVTHVPWCMPGFPLKSWQGIRSWHSRRMRNPQFYVSGKRPMAMKVTIHRLAVGFVWAEWLTGWLQLRNSWCLENNYLWIMDYKSNLTWRLVIQYLDIASV